ncbi:MAG: hypothetical protein ABR549_07375 [Mycobacteriales bacterium]
MPKSSTVAVRVPQRDGEITVSDGTSSVTYTVTDHTITMAPEAVASIVGRLDGAEVLDKK